MGLNCVSLALNGLVNQPRQFSNFVAKMEPSFHKSGPNKPMYIQVSWVGSRFNMLPCNRYIKSSKLMSHMSNNLT